MPNSDIIQLQLLLTQIKKHYFDIFNRHVPIKNKYIRAKDAPFMPKELQKTMMTRSRLRNIFLKHRTDTNNKDYSTQRNLCKKLLKNTMKSYFENLDAKILPITEVSRGLSYHLVKKLTSLMIVKPYLLMRSSVSH